MPLLNKCSIHSYSGSEKKKQKVIKNVLLKPNTALIISFSSMELSSCRSLLWMYNWKMLTASCEVLLSGPNTVTDATHLIRHRLLQVSGTPALPLAGRLCRPFCKNRQFDMFKVSAPKWVQTIHQPTNIFIPVHSALSGTLTLPWQDAKFDSNISIKRKLISSNLRS